MLSEGKLGWSNEGACQGDRAFESDEQREARLEQTRLHARETRVSEGGEQREAEADCSTS